VLVAQVRLAHASRQLRIVATQFRQHVDRRDVFGVVVREPLQLRQMADRTLRRAAELAHPLGDRIGRGEYLARLLVEQRVIVAELALVPR
jgi:hypothetical protein